MKIFSTKEFDDSEYFDKHIIFICDHASFKIPKKFDNLGLTDEHLKSHIGWDIGAKEIAVTLAKKLRQSIFMSNYSRLLIDLNRNINSKSLVVSKSFGIVIPMNKGLSARKKKDRIEKYYEPYHKELSKFILKKQNQYKKIYLVSIHSFTKQGKLFNRGPSFGLLHGKNINLFLLLRKFLITKNVHFGCNYPYSGHFYNYTLDRASKQGMTDNLCVEIRNDLICCKKGITYYSKILHDTFFRILNE